MLTASRTNWILVQALKLFIENRKAMRALSDAADAQEILAQEWAKRRKLLDTGVEASHNRAMNISQEQLTKARIDAAWQLAWEWLERDAVRWATLTQPVRDQLIVGFEYQAKTMSVTEVIKLARKWNSTL